MRKVVSITPVAIERDSRTFKHGSSLEAQARPRVDRARGATERPAGQSAPVRARQRHRSGRRRPRRGGAGIPHRTRLPAAPYTLRAARRAARPAAQPLAAQLRWNLRTYRALPPADLYYLHSYNQFLGVALKARRPGVPYVYDAHDYYLEEDSSPEAAGIGRLPGQLLAAIEQLRAARGAA